MYSLILKAAAMLIMGAFLLGNILGILRRCTHSADILGGNVLLNIDDSCKNGKQYNGNTYKFGVTINGVDYIVKYPKGNDLSVYSEYISSKLINAMGIPCHEVILAMHHGIVVNLITDFTSGTELSLHSFKDTKQSSEDTDMEYKEYTYADVLYLIDKHLKMTDIAKENAKAQFWNMFICDAIIGNRDRHWGNWGYLSNGHTYVFAPLYDNGAGLFPNVCDVIRQYADLSSRHSFLYDRVFVFPASLFKIRRPDRAYRTNYAEMFDDLSVNDILAKQVLHLKEHVSYQELFRIVSNIVFDLSIEPIYKRFYVEIITLRYMCIILRLDFEKSYTMVEGMLEHEKIGEK